MARRQWARAFDNTRMTADELIAKAKEHVSKIQPTGGDQLSAVDFPRASLRETATICFESDARTDRVYVFLDRDSGEFVTIMYAHGIGRPSKV